MQKWRPGAMAPPRDETAVRVCWSIGCNHGPCPNQCTCYLGHQDELAMVWPSRLSECGTNFALRGSSTTRRWKPPAPVSDESVIGFARDGHPTDRLPTHPSYASPQRDFGRAFSYEERSCARSDLTTERRRRGSKNSPDSATKAAKESSVKLTLVYKWYKVTICYQKFAFLLLRRIHFGAKSS